jgi:hypothetical protein
MHKQDTFAAFNGFSFCHNATYILRTLQYQNSRTNCSVNGNVQTVTPMESGKSSRRDS